MLAAMLQDNLRVEHDKCEVVDARVQTVSNSCLASTANVQVISSPCFVSAIGLYNCMSTVTNVTEENPLISDDNFIGSTDGTLYMSQLVFTG